MAADALGSSGHNIEYQRTGGWFITKLQAGLLAALVIILIVLAALLGRSSFDRTSQITSVPENETTVIAGVVPDIGIKPSEEKTGGSQTILEVPMSLYQVQPIHYDVYLQPEIEMSEHHKKVTFTGNVTIIIHAKDAVKDITLQARELSIIASTLSLKEHEENYDIQKYNVAEEMKSNFTVTLKSYNLEDGILNLGFDKTISPDKFYDLQMGFSGFIHEVPYGIFYSENLARTSPMTPSFGHVTATNFDAPFAGTIFPCFELPGQKSTFQMHIARRQDMVTVSSMPLNHTTSSENGFFWDHFNPTERINIDQLGFVISNLMPEIKSTNTIHRFTIWSQSVATEGEFSYIIDTGPKLIDFYTDYFGLHIPTRKLDIFVMNSFLESHKTNFGIALIKETSAIVTSNSTSEVDKENVAEEISMVINQQWLGSMITLNSYDDNWLKISLSHYMSYIAVNEMEPRWNVYDDFLASIIQETLHERSYHFTSNMKFNRKSNNYPNIPDFIPQIVNNEHKIAIHSRPILQTTNSSKKILEDNNQSSFEKLSYNKGTCILHMLRKSLTEFVFKTSLKKLLELAVQNEYVTKENFWDILTTEANGINHTGYKLLPDGISVTKIIKPWLENSGYPLLTVSRNYKTGEVTFQQMFFALDEITGQSLWYVPISYTSGNSRNFTDSLPKLWLDKDQPKLSSTLSDVSNETWLLVNPQQTGFYRVQYDRDNWRMLNNALIASELPATIASQIIDDAFHLSWHNLLSYEFTLNMTISLSRSNIREYSPWHTVIQRFNNINIMLSNSTNYNIYKNFIRELLEPVFQHHILTDKTNYTHTDVILKPEIFVTTCIMGSEECISKSRISFDNWKSISNPDMHIPIEPDLRYAITCCALHNGNATDFEFVLQQYQKTSPSNAEKIELLRSMLCTINSSSFETLLNTITLQNDLSVPELELVHNLWQSIADLSLIHRDILSYVIKNWDDIYNRYSRYAMLLTDIITAATINISTQDELDKLMKFKDSHANQLVGVKESVDNAINQIKLNMKWRQHNENDIINWMKSHSPKLMPENVDKTTTTPPMSLIHRIKKAVLG